VAIPIINTWKCYYPTAHEGLGSSYERIVLNKLLSKIYNEYDIHSALEAPCFGFTGVSGINLVALAQAGCAVQLQDHDPSRLELIRETWLSLKLSVSTGFNRDYRHLDFPDKALDFGFNFSAMWFVEDLPAFVAELCRVIRSCILICVPNRDGIGFKGQLKGYSPDRYPDLHPAAIDPPSIIWLMRKQGWKLVAEDYIDCPPWPDIGMNKEDYVKQLFGKEEAADLTEARELPQQPLSILPYYRGEDPDFARRMLRFGALELIAPRSFKRIWAHHRYLLFTP
jgi:hypothetical protein